MIRTKKKIIIVGGGLTGLTLAYALRHHEMVLIEATDRLGGWIHTTITPDFLFEHGPRAIRAHHVHTLSLVRELGLPLLPATKAASRRFVIERDQLRPFSLRHGLRCGVLKAIWKDWHQKPQPRSEESIATFSRRHFGERWTTECMDPLVRGIFGGSIEQLSASCCFPKLWNLDQMKGRVIPSLLTSFMRNKGLFSFADGMECITRSLASRIPEYYLSTPMMSFERGVVHCPGRSIEGDVILLAIPSWQLSSLLDIPSPSYLSLRLVHLGWQRERLQHDGYGFLLPSTASSSLMGMTFDSALFPCQPGTSRITAFFAGHISEEVAKQEAIAAAIRWCGFSAAPDCSDSVLAHRALPEYHVGYTTRFAELQRRLPLHVIYAGSGCLGIGMEGAIERALDIAQLLDHSL